VADLLAAARELERSLAGLLALLDSRQATPQALDLAARTCADGFEAMRASIESGAAQDTVDLDGVLRANAIARDLVARRQDELATALDRVRAARRTLGHLGDAGTAGGSCDVAG
jgi:hypothetical protein